MQKEAALRAASPGTGPLLAASPFRLRHSLAHWSSLLPAALPPPVGGGLFSLHRRFSAMVFSVSVTPPVFPTARGFASTVLPRASYAAVFVSNRGSPLIVAETVLAGPPLRPFSSCALPAIPDPLVTRTFLEHLLCMSPSTLKTLVSSVAPFSTFAVLRVPGSSPNGSSAPGTTGALDAGLLAEAVSPSGPRTHRRRRNPRADRQRGALCRLSLAQSPAASHTASSGSSSRRLAPTSAWPAPSLPE